MELLVDDEIVDAGTLTVTDLVVVTVVGAVSVVTTVSVVDLVSVVVTVPVLVVTVVTVVGTVVVTVLVLVVPVVTVVVVGTDVVTVLVLVVVVGLVSVVDTVAVVDVVLVVLSVVVVGLVVVVVVVADVVVVASPPHEFDRTKSSPSEPVPSVSDGSFVPASVTNALVSVAPPSASTTTPMKPPVLAWTKVMLSTEPPVKLAVKPLPVKSQFSVLGTTKCHHESLGSGAVLSGIESLLHVVVATAVGTCDDLTHSVLDAQVGAEVRLIPLDAGAPSVPNPMNARPAVHNAAPARRTANVERRLLASRAERRRRRERFRPPPITGSPS